MDLLLLFNGVLLVVLSILTWRLWTKQPVQETHRPQNAQPERKTTPAPIFSPRDTLNADSTACKIRPNSISALEAITDSSTPGGTRRTHRPHTPQPEQQPAAEHISPSRDSLNAIPNGCNAQLDSTSPSEAITDPWSPGDTRRTHRPRTPQPEQQTAAEHVFPPRDTLNNVITAGNTQPDSISPSDATTDPSSPGVTRNDASLPPEKSQSQSTAAMTDAQPPSTRAPQPTCFRICGIPSDWDCSKLKEHLRTIDSELDLEAAELSGPFPDCDDSTQTALLNLNYCTAYFRLKPNEEKQKVITETTGRKVRLSIDKHFYDLTPLNRAEDPIKMDVIAITGLGGHAFGSWRSRIFNERPLDRAMWLRDFLPERFPNARVMTYGYDSSLKEPNRANLTDYRRNFIQCLHNARRKCPKRPLFFIGHSLGGLLVVQTLVEISNAERHDIRDSIRGIFFFGTPHQGLRTVELEEMVDEDTDNQKVSNLLAQLREGSEFLENQKEALSRLWGKFPGKVFTFYETEKTKSVKMVAPGSFERGGEEVQMVQRFSAQLYLPKESRFPIQSNHTDMVKFDSERNRAFQTVVTCMEESIDQTDRTRILQTLLSSVRVSDIFFLDRGEYLDKKPKVGLEQDGKYFWIFRNLDFEKWTKGEVNLLGLRGPSSEDLEIVASYVIRTLRGSASPLDETLYFFYGSARDINRPSDTVDWHNLVCVCTLLRQVMENDNRPPTLQTILLETFIKLIFKHIDNKELQKLYAEPTRAFKSLLYLSKSQHLWEALGWVLSQAAGYDLERQQPPAPQIKRTLTLIFDLKNITVPAWQSLIVNLRQLTAGLQQIYRIVKVLVTNLPVSGDLGLQQSSEILLEYDTERQECLKALCFNNTRYEKISLHHEYTFEWLWKNSGYSAWNASEHSNFLFIEGKPGSGKSTLVRYFADHFQADGAIVAKFFYSHRDGESERDHRNMLQKLLHDILKADETFFIHFQHVYRDLHGLGGRWRRENLKDILRACRKHPLERKIFLIVDALDESEEAERADIIQFLWDLSNSVESAVKVFVASRPINEFQQTSKSGSHHILLQEETKKDIERYTNTFLQKPEFNDVPGIKEAVKVYIANTAEGVFLWVKLLEKELVRKVMKGLPEADILEFLKSLPRELGGYYEYSLEKLAQGEEDDIRDGIRIFLFCIFSHRAIQLEELVHALAILRDPPPEPSSLDSARPTSIKRRLNHCTGSFIELRNKHRDGRAVVQVMHQTVREFFLLPHDAVSNTCFRVVENATARGVLRTACARYLSLHHKEAKNFQSAHANWSSDDFRKFVEYLDGRPFLGYTLESFSQRSDVDPLLSELSMSFQNSASPAFCLLKRLVKSSTQEKTVQQQLNDLLKVAAEEGRVFAASNLLTAGADCESVDERGWRALHRSASNGHHATVQLLLEHGADIGARNTRSWTPLHLAVDSGHEATVRLLLDQGADIRATSNDAWSPLHRAAHNAHEDMVRLLLDRGAEIEAKNADRMTPLHLAADSGHENMVGLLLDQGADIEARKADSRTPLHLAAQRRHAAMIELLLDRGANIEARTSLQGMTALHLAADSGHEATVQLLLDRGADIEAKTEGARSSLHGMTPLHLAAERRHEAMIQLLLDRGADIDARTSLHGMTALHLAAQRTDEAMVQLLLDRGADINARNADSSTSLHLAADSGHENTVGLLLDRGANSEASVGLLSRTALHLAAQRRRRREAMIRLLLDRGADIEAKNARSWTPLHLVVHGGHKTTVRLLLYRGADIHAKTDGAPRSLFGMTPLHLAAQRRHEAMIQLLLDRGADIDARTSLHGMTALHLAAQRTDEAIVQLLLDRGADIEAKTEDARSSLFGMTALHLAAQRKHEAMVQLLLDQGADIGAKISNDAWSPLHLAAANGHEAMVSLLLDRGAEIRAEADDAWTPLHLAADSGNEATVRLLLDRGADIGDKDTRSRTPLHLAANSGHEDTVRLLLDRGADIQAKTEAAWTPLRLAASNGHEPIVQLLLNRGADVSANNNDAWLPLDLAASKGHEGMVSVLLDRRAIVAKADGA